jgi:hypothetical protein
LKAAIIGLIAVFVAVLAILVTPWYPVTTSYQVPQTFTQTTTSIFEVPTTTYQMQNVYSLSSPFTIPGAQNPLTRQAFVSNPFYLEVGSALYVTATCTHCVIGVHEDFGNYSQVEITLNGKSPQEQGTVAYPMVVPQSGLYVAEVGNINLLYPGSSLETGSIMLSQLSVVASVPQASSLTETGYNTEYSTQLLELTEQSVTSTSPYSVLGTFPSLLLLAIVGLLVVLSVLLDQGILSASTKRRRRR